MYSNWRKQCHLIEESVWKTVGGVWVRKPNTEMKRLHAKL